MTRDSPEPVVQVPACSWHRAACRAPLPEAGNYPSSPTSCPTPNAAPPGSCRPWSLLIQAPSPGWDHGIWTPANPAWGALARTGSPANWNAGFVARSVSSTILSSRRDSPRRG